MPASPYGDGARSEGCVVRRLLVLLYYLGFAAVLALVVYFLRSNLNVLSELGAVPFRWWGLAIALFLATLLVKGISFDLLAKVYGATVPIKDSVAITSFGLLGNYMLPGNTSVPLRSLYLQRLHGLSYKRFIPLALSAFVFSTGLYGVLAGIAAILLGPVDSEAFTTVMILFTFIGLALILMLLLPLRYSAIPFVGHYAELVLKGWRLLVSSPSLFTQWLVIEFIRAALEVAFFLTIVRMLNVPMSWEQALIITLAKECSIFLRLTPGAFGVVEGIQAFFAFIFDLDVARVVLAGVAARVLEIVCLSVVSLLLMRGLKRRLFVGSPASIPDDDKGVSAAISRLRNPND